MIQKFSSYVNESRNTNGLNLKDFFESLFNYAIITNNLESFGNELVIHTMENDFYPIVNGEQMQRPLSAVHIEFMNQNQIEIVFYVYETDRNNGEMQFEIDEIENIQDFIDYCDNNCK